MEILDTFIEGVRVIRPKRWADERGFFSEVFRADILAAHQVAHDWKQDNHALSKARGTIRGLHFQTLPHVQAKLIRVVRGAVYDVAVDLRVGSPTYGQHVSIELSAANWTQLYVPPGFAHGFCTLEADTEVVYKVSGEYDARSERGLRWDDAALKIQWPVSAELIFLNQRDREWPDFSNLESPFV